MSLIADSSQLIAHSKMAGRLGSWEARKPGGWKAKNKDADLHRWTQKKIR
jgi:hypothetical protein